MTVWDRLSPAQKAEAVRPLAADGHSAAQIAVELSKRHGYLTRQAVIGICHRQNIALKGNPRKARRAAGKARVTAAKAEKNAARRGPPSKARAENRKHAAPAVVPPVPEPETPAPRVLGVPLVDAPASACRWPLWHREDDPRNVCGKEAVRGPYCAAHALIAYQPDPIDQRDVERGQ
ncbi:MAG: hypothetical protein JJ902_18320 [Roseibium sp.]|nr:hypothetical protein [Roseibium sp.]